MHGIRIQANDTTGVVMLKTVRDMNDLFDGRFAPITNTIGFIQCDRACATQFFFDWQQDIQKKRGVALVQETIPSDLESAILRLLPLTSVERRRYLFIPTRSNWTTFLDNGHQGTDVFSPLSYLAKNLSCVAVRATCVPEGQIKQYPATILELYGPQPSVSELCPFYSGSVRWSKVDLFGRG